MVAPSIPQRSTELRLVSRISMFTWYDLWKLTYHWKKWFGGTIGICVSHNGPDPCASKVLWRDNIFSPIEGSIGCVRHADDVKQGGLLSAMRRCKVKKKKTEKIGAELRTRIRKSKIKSSIPYRPPLNSPRANAMTRFFCRFTHETGLEQNIHVYTSQPFSNSK